MTPEGQQAIEAVIAEMRAEVARTRQYRAGPAKVAKIHEWADRLALLLVEAHRDAHPTGEGWERASRSGANGHPDVMPITSRTAPTQGAIRPLVQTVAFSGGKDSTAMALLMAERGEDFALLFTPAGDEPQELFDHVNAIAARIGKGLIYPANRPLDFWIDHHNALPSWRMRWCTRQIKIEPCIAWLSQHPDSTLCVGLRADEPPEERTGLYGDHCTYRYPLREEGWNEADVYAYLARRGVTVPKRTNCELCYGQRLSEWWELWKERPEKFAKGEAYEARTGHTFRSPGRDTWPAALAELRIKFERGDVPQGVDLNRELFDDVTKPCRVCSL